MTSNTECDFMTVWERYVSGVPLTTDELRSWLRSQDSHIRSVAINVLCADSGRVTDLDLRWAAGVVVSEMLMIASGNVCDELGLELVDAFAGAIHLLRRIHRFGDTELAGDIRDSIGLMVKFAPCQKEMVVLRALEHLLQDAVMRPLFEPWRNDVRLAGMIETAYEIIGFQPAPASSENRPALRETHGE